jgi:hypothetical protein
VVFPTLEQIEKASREELAWWYRFLTPTNDDEQKIIEAVSKKFKAQGGMTLELSHRIGFGGV